MERPAAHGVGRWRRPGRPEASGSTSSPHGQTYAGRTGEHIRKSSDASVFLVSSRQSRRMNIVESDDRGRSAVRSNSWGSGQNSTSSSMVSWSQLRWSASESWSRSSSAASDRAMLQSEANGQESMSPDAEDGNVEKRSTGICPMCRRSHDLAVRPTRPKRRFLKARLEEVMQVENEEKRLQALRRFLKRGPYACRLVSQVANIDCAALLEAETEESPLPPGAFEPEGSVREDAQSSGSTALGPRLPGLISASGYGGRVHGAAPNSSKLSL
eukprot:TRINITY_DN34332_c0_g1_i1.p1 TRINITY_DN34332_c0_g1~~TRINITY_DN34332_c0_g1_i1.p1  ORF type:complete len:271 (-),score=31.75 TRINITY_DN34332_c0_g1_i1:75-887(-)